MVFSLNTVIGFSCAIGMDMGFHSHHHEEIAIEVSSTHHHSKFYSHDEKDLSLNTANDNENCCNDGVMKFQKVDKNIATSFSLNSILFFTSLIPSFYSIDNLSGNNHIYKIKYVFQQHHPPIPDIRIAIQSFQI